MAIYRENRYPWGNYPPDKRAKILLGRIAEVAERKTAVHADYAERLRKLELLEESFRSELDTVNKWIDAANLSDPGDNSEKRLLTKNERE